LTFTKEEVKTLDKIFRSLDDHELVKLEGMIKNVICLRMAKRRND